MKSLERLKRRVAPHLRAFALRAGWVTRHTLSGRRPDSPHATRASAMREVATLAWPIAVAMLGETAMGLVDTRLVGALGALRGDVVPVDCDGHVYEVPLSDIEWAHLVFDFGPAPPPSKRKKK